MTRLGDEMILELAALLGNLNKQAAKKDEEKACAECGKEDCPCGCKGDSDKCKCKEKEEKEDEKDKKDDKKEKKDAVMFVLNGLSKLATELDEAGAEEASSLVDDALKVIVENMKNEKSE